METPHSITIRVSSGMRVLQMIFALPFTIGFFAFLYFITRGYINLIIPLIIFAGLAYLGWANAFSSIKVNEEYVKVKVFYGIFQINWDEIENVIVNNELVVLSGHGKRVVLSLVFANKEKEQLLSLLSEQSEIRHIKLEKANSALSITHLNSRVWR